MNLERLAELINERWPNTALLFGSGLILKRNCETLHLSDTDSQNAKFIIWCLDRLEELGWNDNPLDFRKAKGIWHVNAWKERDPGNTCAISIERLHGEAPTRAEACALALAQALEENANNPQ